MVRTHSVAVYRRVSHPWLVLFDLVLDVESYPRFVPGCTDDRVLHRRDVSPGRTEIVSRMTVGRPPLQFSYTNRTLADRETKRISVASNDGPLRLLNVLWRFVPLDLGRTEIAFTACHEFRSAIVASLAAGLLETLFSRIVEAFEHRADAVAGFQQRASSGPAVRVSTRVPSPRPRPVLAGT
jgi:coenzyme Q-binding protein COQ10